MFFLNMEPTFFFFSDLLLIMLIVNRRLAMVNKVYLMHHVLMIVEPFAACFFPL